MTSLKWSALSILALAIGAAAGYVAWNHTKPLYTSDGLVRIAYSMPVVLKETDQNSPLPMFDNFMASQKTLITSRRVSDAAIQDPVWRALGRAVPENPDQYFSEHLFVTIEPKSDLIRISIQDPDPVTAAAAVNSIVNAYSDLYTLADKQLERQRNGLLSDQQNQDAIHITQLSRDLTESSREFGTTNLEPFTSALTTRIAKLQDAIDTANLVRPQVPGVDAPLTSDQIAMIDPVMRSYIDKRDQQKDELTRLAVTYPGTSPQVASARDLLAQSDARLTAYVDHFNQFLAAQTNALLLARQDLTRLGLKQRDIDMNQSKLAALKLDEAEISQRMEALRTEGALGGRLSIITTGEVPLSPALDPRINAASLAGGVGFLAPFALALALLPFRRQIPSTR